MTNERLDVWDASSVIPFRDCDGVEAAKAWTMRQLRFERMLDDLERRMAPTWNEAISERHR